MTFRELPSNVVSEDYFSRRRFFPEAFMESSAIPRSRDFGGVLDKAEDRGIISEKARKIIEFPRRVS